MSNPITLKLNAASLSSDSVAGWQAETYVLTSAARGGDQAPLPVELAPDDVLELELEDGTLLLVAAEDAERYLGGAISRGEGVAGEIQVGPTLRLSGQHLPLGPSRDGMGAWALKSLRVFKRGPAGMTALMAAGTFQDHQLDHRSGLQRLSTTTWGLTAIEKMPPSNEPALLFLHGTASSTGGSFKSLWGGEGAELDARAFLARAYGDRVYGYEHRSLTESPIANVLALLDTLPEGGRLHVVSHSRGGMLGELLARANRLNSDPFTEADIRRFLEHGKRTGRVGYEQDAESLRKLNQAMKQRSLRIERFVRVAGTARGTTLASGRLDRWASVMLNLIGKGLMAVPGLQPAAKGYDLLRGFLLAVVKERTDARVLPGLEAMMPDSPLVALLNAPDVAVDFPLHVIAGDYQGDGLLSWLGDCLSEAFYGGETDLVVNTPSMSGGAARPQGIWRKFLAGPKVTHFSYFQRKESAQPLLEALAGGNDSFERLTGPSRVELARGGKYTKPLPEGPIALMLPGIMGSHLALESDRIWFDPINMIAGEMARLNVNAVGVTPSGWMDVSYENFAQHLAQSHEVRPFAYDWRLSIVEAAEKFGKVLDDAMKDAAQRKQPLRIVAHSMGGLVARLAMKSRWDKFKAIPGSRLVQFGTPNNGSHSIAAVLMGRDAFVQKIERWFDWKHDMREFLDIVRDFPGVLELLPWPLQDGVAGDGLDYFDAQVWQAWSDQDAENRDRKDRGTDMKFERAKGAGDGWPVPPTQRLLDAKSAILQVQAAPLDPDCTLYVAGSEKTPVAIRLQNGQVEIGWTDRGDGRVPWDTGIPPGVKVWYVDAAHGDLLGYEEAFDEYVTLLETGTCRLSTAQSGTRDAGAVRFTPAPLAVYTLYPSAEEVMAAAVGGRAPRKRAKATSIPTVIEVIHGSLAGADTPVLIGAYAHDPIGGSAGFLDQHLGGNLKRAQKMGRYPAQAGEAMVFLPASPQDKPGGAIVVGLGALGELKPGMLSRALAHGFMEYARQWAEMNPATGQAKDEKTRGVNLSTVLVGTGYAGLSVELGMRALAEALRRANQSLAQADMSLRIGNLTLFEEEESRAIAAANALRELARDRKYAGLLSYDGRIRLALGRYRGRCVDQGGANGWQRVHITAGNSGGLRFTLLTDRARNEVDDEPDQRQAVDGLIRASTSNAADQPGLSRALFELMVPNGFKEALPDLRGLILGVDAVAAAYPWELMRDEAERYEQPLVTRIGVVRQLASPHGRKGVATVEEPRVLVVGDTQSGFVELPGAQQEGRMVAGLFQERGYDVNPLIRPDGQTVLVNLFDGHYRIIHLAAHGMLARDEQDARDDKPGAEAKRYTGMVLGPNTILTTAQVSKLRRVPELVFINCCHLGSMAADVRPRWGELAANLATEFIEMGCKAVIAAGWAVDDAAADTFAGAFYRAMLDGKKFGDAVLAARAETWQRHPGSNTWGAYQAYGDERYRLLADQEDAWQAPDYLHAGQISGDLERLQARIGPANADEQARYRKQLETIESAARARFFNLAEIRERFAAAWADLGDSERAIAHYRAALAQEDATSSLHALEQLANLEIRLGAERIGEPEGEQLMQTGLQRLEALLVLGETVERLSLLGSAWKRRAHALHQAKAKIGEVRAALEQMLTAYRKASDLSLQTTGERDYNPTLNALDGALLLAALGNRKPLEELASQRADWLAEAARNGNRRFAGERDFFHALAEPEAARVDALWTMLEGGETLDQAKVRDALVAHYRDLFTRLGNNRAHDSSTRQLQWLIDLLPNSKRVLRTTLRQLKEAIEAAGPA